MVHYNSASASHSVLVNATRLLAWPLEVRRAQAPVQWIAPQTMNICC